jgi:hypothetical protein
LMSNGVAVATRASDWADWKNCPPFDISRVTKAGRQVKTQTLPALAPPLVNRTRGGPSGGPARVLSVYKRLAVEAKKDGESGVNRQREVVHPSDDKQARSPARAIKAFLSQMSCLLRREGAGGTEGRPNRDRPSSCTHPV